VISFAFRPQTRVRSSPFVIFNAYALTRACGGRIRDP